MDKMILKRVEIALWLLGFACLGVYVASHAQSNQAQADAIALFARNETVQSTQTPNTALWSEKRIASYDPGAANALPPLGVLNIPNIDVRVAVFDGTSDKVLDVGAGRVPGTARIASAGNLAIAAHRDGFFRGLKDIEIGDELSFSNQEGKFQYRVTETLVVEPADVSVLEPTEHPTITLITCYPFYFVGSAPQRFIVRAELSTDEPELIRLEN